MNNSKYKMENIKTQPIINFLTKYGVVARNRIIAGVCNRQVYNHSTKQVIPILDEMIELGLVEKVKVDGKKYIQLTNNNI